MIQNDKNTLTISQLDKKPATTWDEANYSWDDAHGTWDVPALNISQTAKNTLVISQNNKNV